MSGDFSRSDARATSDLHSLNDAWTPNAKYGKIGNTAKSARNERSGDAFPSEQ